MVKNNFIKRFILCNQDRIPFASYLDKDIALAWLDLANSQTKYTKRIGWQGTSFFLEEAERPIEDANVWYY